MRSSEQMRYAFLPPPSLFRLLNTSNCPTTRLSRRRVRIAAQASLDDDFFISTDDLNHSVIKPSNSNESYRSVAHDRRESKRLELDRAAASKQWDDDEARRNQVADEQLSATDLFGLLNSPKSEVKKSDCTPCQPQWRKMGSRSSTESNGAAEGSAVSEGSGLSEKKPKTERLPPLQGVADTIRPGDLVMHSRHGIGKFRGLERSTGRMSTTAQSGSRPVQEYAVIEYRDGDVYVPLSHFELLTKLSPREATHVGRLDTVSGSTDYPGNTLRKSRSSYLARQKTRSKIRKQLVNLHGIYAERTTLDREPFPVHSTEEQIFATRCNFTMTGDQKTATSQILDDLSARRTPMDRLLCGDVGFGKTEVAIRAAFRVLRAGKQVAVLAPTTILAQQHHETFRQRFEEFYPEYPIACLTRFAPRKAVVAAKKALKDGKMQIGIGTHMILNDGLTFKNLGLLIIDEEHRFGVNQKEKLRERYRAVDALFLSATPIPRTLHLTLSGIRDASVLRTPPLGRKRVITKVSPSGAGVVRQAISKEIDRGGQVFFVVPRIEGIEAEANWIKDICPTLRVLVAHGSVQDLAKRIWAFAQRKYDVLVCTTIIENGINMPSVNTVIIRDAGRFGLAQLHQLRGRVGRSQEQAYAWLLYNPEPGMQAQPAADRLKVLEKHSDLGSGFAIAQKDMEMRGIGTILGVEQHGNISVNAEEYARILAEELEYARTGKPIPITLPVTDSIEVFLPVASYIPEEYIPDFEQKMTAYGFFSNATTTKDLRRIAKDLEQRYGPLPPPTRRHVSVLKVKILAKRLGIRKISSERQHVILDWALEESAFKRLVAFLPDKQYRSQCEQLVSEERVVLRGLGMCSGDVQLTKLMVFLGAFCKTATGFKRERNNIPSEVKLAQNIYDLSKDV